MKRINRDELYMSIAKLYSRRSTCGRLQVGCTIVKEGRAICSGYNGPLKSNIAEDTCNCELSEPCQKSIHAEANAIAFAAKKGISLENTTIYCTHSPCIKCSELIIQAGISNVVYSEDFRSSEGLLLLKDNNIKVIKYEPEQI
jgi:dCMP deaminase